MKNIIPNNTAIRYEGRIDLSNPSIPTFIYAGSAIYLRFTGTSIGLTAKNIYRCNESSIGFLIDGKEGKTVLSKDSAEHCYTLAENLLDVSHTLILWKRAGAADHYFDLLGLTLDDSGTISPMGNRPERRIECYGDSVSAGEVCEAAGYEGKLDPPNHEGKYSNSWYAYSMITARNLDAEIHNNAQGGIAVLDDTGYFVGGKIGLVSTWDKLRYNPTLGPCTQWDFSQWTPHVVIMALGQNDSYPDDYIDTDSLRRKRWITGYADIMRKLREKYPKSLFVVITTILNHKPGWDEALDEMVNNLQDYKVVRFRFTRNGHGTPGHPRINEEKEMAEELTNFLKSYGPAIWA